jgi:hypothetical protein
LRSFRSQEGSQSHSNVLLAGTVGKARGHPAFITTRAATRPSSPQNAFMLGGDFNVLEWKHQCLETPIGCRQTDAVSCGLFTCVNTKKQFKTEKSCLGAKETEKSQVNQEKAPLWRLCLFQLTVMNSK